MLIHTVHRKYFPIVCFVTEVYFECTLSAEPPRPPSLLVFTWPILTSNPLPGSQLLIDEAATGPASRYSNAYKGSRGSGGDNGSGGGGGDDKHSQNSRGSACGSFGAKGMKVPLTTRDTSLKVSLL